MRLWLWLVSAVHLGLEPPGRSWAALAHRATTAARAGGGLTADSVVVLPVLVLAEGAAVARHVAAAACLVGLASAVPAVLLQGGETQNGKVKKT